MASGLRTRTSGQKRPRNKVTVEKIDKFALALAVKPKIKSKTAPTKTVGRPKLRVGTFEKETKNFSVFILDGDAIKNPRRVYVTPGATKVTFVKSDRQEKEGITWYLQQQERFANKFAVKRDAAKAPASLTFSLTS